MAHNGMFTTRSGKQVPIPEIRIPAEAMIAIMRLREDNNLRPNATHLSDVGMLLDVLDKGVYTIRAHWKAAAKNKELRNAGKNVKEYIRVQLALGKPIDSNVVAELTGMQIPNASQATAVEEEDEVLDGDSLTDEQLEAATSPNGAA